MQSDCPFKIRYFEKCDYLSMLKAMQRFTQTRTEETIDEIWFLEHNPVYTIGKRGALEDILAPTNTPIIHTDRGGRVTYHGPGQLVIYPLLNLNQLKWHLRKLVNTLEISVIQLLADYHIKAHAKKEAPGVYIEDTKVAFLGIRIQKNYCFHGLAINVNMDLSPFEAIRPCGLEYVKIGQLVDWIADISLDKVVEKWLTYFKAQLCSNDPLT